MDYNEFIKELKYYLSKNHISNHNNLLKKDFSDFKIKDESEIKDKLDSRLIMSEKLEKLEQSFIEINSYLLKVKRYNKKYPLLKRNPIVIKDKIKLSSLDMLTCDNKKTLKKLMGIKIDQNTSCHIDKQNFLLN